MRLVPATAIRLVATGLATAGLLASFVGTALAANPHFVSASASGPGSSGVLIVAFRLAGLRDGERVTVTAIADAVARYACRNTDGSFPSNPARSEESGVAAGSGDFSGGKSAQVTASLTLSPPSTSLVCPTGQEVVLVSMVYTGVQLQATGAGTRDVPGTFSRTYFTI